MSCLSVCLLVTTSLRTAILHFTLYDHDPAEIADLIEIPFGCGLVGSQVTMYQMGGGQDPVREGPTLGVVFLALLSTLGMTTVQYTAKEIMCMRVCLLHRC